jgi:hypothetical protein
MDRDFADLRPVVVSTRIGIPPVKVNGRRIRPPLRMTNQPFAPDQSDTSRCRKVPIETSIPVARIPASRVEGA